ncbi:MAG: hypothetical protein O2888_00645 [Chloroflexi bacterium]|nr:hypothetical protein [Chloroflexota bacterium]
MVAAGALPDVDEVAAVRSLRVVAIDAGEDLPLLGIVVVERLVQDQRADPVRLPAGDVDRYLGARLRADELNPVQIEAVEEPQE